MRYLKTIIMIALALTLVLAPPAMAQEDESGTEEGSHFKKTWNSVWKFINFFILVFIIVKFGRKPLMEFLKKHSSEIGDRIGKQNTLLEEAKGEYREAEQKLTHIEQLIADVEEFMRQDAQRSKEEIIKEAGITASAIMTDAKERSQSMLKNAQQELKQELVELAMEEAEKLIRKHISPEDQDKLIVTYVDGIEAAAQA